MTPEEIHAIAKESWHYKTQMDGLIGFILHRGSCLPTFQDF